MENVATTTSNLQTLTTFAEHNPGLFMFSCIMIFLAVAAAGFFIYKIIIFIFKRVKGLKIGDKELKMEEDGPQIENKPENYVKFTSTISAIIQYSINAGYSNCVKRQELFETQLNHVKENFDIIQTAIIENYISNDGLNVEIVRALLHHTINKTIIQKFRNILIADKLAEKTKDGVIELNRNFIENAYTDLWIELKNLVNYTSVDSNGKRMISDSVLLDSLKNQKDSLKKMMVNSLEFAYDQAIVFLNEVQENNSQLDEKIQNLLNIHFEGSADNIQHSWVNDSAAIPPNNVVGV